MTGGALYSSMRPLVRTQTLAAFLDTRLPASAANTLRLSYGGSNISFQEVRDPGLLPSAMFPNEPFLLNAPRILNVSQQNGSNAGAQFVTAASSPVQWTNLLTTAFPNTADLIKQNLTPTTEAITGPVGQVNVAGFSSLGVDPANFPQTRADKTFQLADTIVKSIGAHTLTVGFDFWNIRLNSNVNSGARPQFDFWGQRLLPSTLPGGLAYSPSANSDPLLLPTDMVAAGLPQADYQTLDTSTNSTLSLTRNQIDVFFQDELRLAAGFRLTVGGRLELNRLPASADGRFSAYNPATFQTNLSSAVGGCTANTMNQNYCMGVLDSLNQVAPPSFDSVFGAHPIGLDGRLGFAWDASHNGKTVVRGGFGQYTGQFPEVITTQSRNVFPTYLPLNLANAPSGIYLYNIANPNVCVHLNLQSNCTQTQPVSSPQNLELLCDEQQNSQALPPIVQPGTLNQLGSQYPDPLFFVARCVNRLSSLNLVQPSSNLHNPYALQYGLTVDRRLTEDFVLSVAYVGTGGASLVASRNSGSSGGQPGIDRFCDRNDRLGRRAEPVSGFYSVHGKCHYL